MRSVRIILVAILVIANFTGFCFSAEAEQATDRNSCMAPAKGPILTESNKQAMALSSANDLFLARIGKQAPDFEANAFVRGEFKNIKLSDHKGKWVVMCFYPGDFTFV